MEGGGRKGVEKENSLRQKRLKWRRVQKLPKTITKPQKFKVGKKLFTALLKYFGSTFCASKKKLLLRPLKKYAAFV